MMNTKIRCPKCGKVDDLSVIKRDYPNLDLREDMIVCHDCSHYSDGHFDPCVVMEPVSQK